MPWVGHLDSCWLRSHISAMNDLDQKSTFRQVSTQQSEEMGILNWRWMDWCAPHMVVRGDIIYSFGAMLDKYQGSCLWYDILINHDHSFHI